MLQNVHRFIIANKDKGNDSPHPHWSLSAEILPQLSASFSMWKSQGQRGVKFCSSADPPLEVVSEAQQRRTEPVWVDKPAAQSRGVSVW